MQNDEVLKIYPLSDSKCLTPIEAKGLGSLFTYLTDCLKKDVRKLELQLQSTTNPETIEILQTKISHLIDKWSEKIKRLGGIPINLNQIKIPTSAGYLYWEHITVNKQEK